MDSQIHSVVGVASNKNRKRVGRGSSAGGGKTAGRGTKGQKSRTGGQIPAYFEGGQMPLIQRIAKKKGFKSHRRFVTLGINLNDLDRWATEGKIDVQQLITSGKIKPGVKVKVLGTGKVSGPFTLQVHQVSKSALAAVEAAGGQVTLVK